jgi:malate synthase
MSNRVEKSGLQVDAALAAFIESEVLAPLGRDADAFWQGFAALVGTYAPQNKALLARRDHLQARIDAWHGERAGKPIEGQEYQAFLREIGYLVPEPAPFAVTTKNVDREIAAMAGPQLVVPVLNARFLLNAANARWGSLYDAYYGTDALDAPPARPGGYDEQRGAAVIKAARAFLDLSLPLAGMSWSDWDGEGVPPLADASQFCGQRPGGLLFANNGLHIEVVLDRAHAVGRTDKAGIADVVLEAALTTICDMEDSVAAVDAEDKLNAYRNWLGVIRGDLADTFEKGGQTMTRTLNGDRDWGDLVLPGRSLLFVRNVGHLMTNPAILLADGGEIPEGIMDAVLTSAIGALGLARTRHICQQPLRLNLHRQAQDAWAGRVRLYQ